MSDPSVPDPDRMVEISIEVTRPVAEQIVAAAQLTGQHPTGFVEESVLSRLQALDNILHEEANIDLPPDFDAAAWRERYQKIRRPEVYGEEGSR